MSVLAIWMPPKKSSFYDYGITYLNCSKCSASINPGTMMGVSDQDLQRMTEGNAPYYAECTKCAIKSFIYQPETQETLKNFVEEYLNNATGRLFLKEIIREELKTLIKEEAYDPNGTFSPHGPQQT